MRPLAALGSCLVVLGLAACTGDGGPSPEQKAAQAFLTAVGSGDVAAAAALTDDPGTATTGLRASLAGLGSGAEGGCMPPERGRRSRAR